MKLETKRKRNREQVPLLWPLGISRLEWAMREEIVDVLHEFPGDITRASNELGISRPTLYKYIQRFQIGDGRWKATDL
jgi:transcriptional regulator of acetoin/glycerol metabolism